MKDRIIEFIKDFENDLANVFITSNDYDYRKYCLGQKDVCLKCRTIINNNDNFKDKIIELKKEFETSDEEQKMSSIVLYNNGANNMINYIIKEIDKYERKNI